MQTMILPFAVSDIPSESYHPELLLPVLRIVHRVSRRFLPKRAAPRGSAADTATVTLIKRSTSAANMNIHQHCPLADRTHRSAAGKFRDQHF